MQETVERPRHRRRVFAALTVGAAAIATAGIALAPAAGAFPVVGTTTISASLGSPDTGLGGTTGTQTNRVSRNGVASSCASPHSYPGSYGGTHVYDAYPVSNPYSAPLCVTTTLNTPGSAQIFLVAYTSYNPADPSSGYLADTGVSTDGGSPAASMSFTVPAHATIMLVASDVAGGATGQPYTIDVSAPAPAAPVPNNAPASDGLISGVNIVTPQGSTVNWTASGYAPGAPVEFVLYNGQTYKKQMVLDTVTANSSGTATYTGPVPYTTGIKYVAAIGYKSNAKVLDMTAQTRFM